MSTAPPKRPRIVIPEVAAGRAVEVYPAPAVFRPDRDTAAGRYPLLKVFPGVQRHDPVPKIPRGRRPVLEIARQTWANVTEGPGWMYVAPRRTPPEVRAAGFRMVESQEDEIVVARAHLANSSSMDLYLDVIHEFFHILQRRQGRELWAGPKVAYVDRPTEVEAYAFSVAEARRLGVPDTYLREYLSVSWVGKADSLRLLRHLGVTAK